MAGLAGTIGVLRRRAPAAQRATATACLLTLASAVAVLLASDLFEFSWRYQLPALVTLPPAGALGITVVIGYVASRRQRAGPAPGVQAEAPRYRPARSGLILIGAGGRLRPAWPGPEPGRGEPDHQGQRE